MKLKNVEDDETFLVLILSIYLYKCCRSGPQRSRALPELNQLSLKRAQKRCKKAQKGARKGCSSLPGAASAPGEAVRACFGAACAFEEAVRDCCSRSLFESAGLGYTVL